MLIIIFFSSFTVKNSLVNMACSVGGTHTVCLSDEGIVYTFGNNKYGQLGLGHQKDLCIPSPILILPKIRQVSCGYYFTVCLDEEESLWIFGLQSGNILTDEGILIPQKIEDFDVPVQSIYCGGFHTLIITNDSNLWSFGQNSHSQLFLDHKEPVEIPQQTIFSEISKISAGVYHSIIQNIDGEIYGCGCNFEGGTKVVKNNISVRLIAEKSMNIVDFCCGAFHVLFLDNEGNVFSVGNSYIAELGLSSSKETLIQINHDIPPIQSISCSGFSSFLLDENGDVWSFGANNRGQLGIGDRIARNVPTKINSLKDIQQISFGPRSYHALVKDSQNKIFAFGNSLHGQLGMDFSESCDSPKEINPSFFEIWGGKKEFNRKKSARK